MGPIPVPVPGNQSRPPLPETNPNVRKNDATEKRKRATPMKFRPATPKPTTVHPPLPEAPPKPKNSMPLSVREDTPWPGAGKMLGNLFEDRNCLLPKTYLATENKSENATGISSPKPSLKEEPNIGKQSIISPKNREMQMGTRLSFLQKSGQGRLGWQASRSAITKNITPTKSAKALRKMAPKLTEAWSRSTN